MKALAPCNLSLLLIAVLFLSSPVLASGEEPPIGSVVAVRGEVLATGREGAARSLTMKSAIYRHDTIRTGKNGRAQIIFEDNTIISLGSETVMAIAEYQWDAKGRSGAMQTRVEEGTFRVLGGMITKTSPKKFSTETPAATIGIRGSMYAGSYRGGSLQVLFIGGRGITVGNQQGEVAITRSGFGTRVTLGDRPQEPAPMSGADIQELTEGFIEETGANDEPAGGAGAPEGEVSGETAPGGDKPAEDGASVQLSPENTTLLDGDSAETVSLGSGTGIPASDLSLMSGEVLTSNTADILADTIVPPDAIDPPDTTVPPAPTAVFSGQSLEMMNRSDGLLVENRQLALSAEPVDGLVSLLLGDGTTLSPFTMAAYDPAAVYSEILLGTDTVTISTSTGTFQSGRYLWHDNKGEFFLAYAGDFGLPIDINGVLYSYGGMQFGGVVTPLTALPTSGISSYSGFAVGGNTEPTSDPFSYLEDSHFVDLFASVNWQNRKIMGRISTQDGPEQLYFYGDLAGETADIRLLSAQGWTGAPQEQDVYIMEGKTSFIRFYGSEAQGFGFLANGFDYPVHDQSTSTGWSAIAGAFLAPGSGPVPSPTAPSQLNGWLMGVGQQLSDPAGVRGVWYNENANDFSLTINPETGAVTGSAPFMNIGSTGSAVIDGQLFVAEISDRWNTPAGLAMEPHGNFLVTADPGQQFSEYATWGYWNMSYTDNSATPSALYHVHSPGAYWIAGNATSVSALNELSAGSFTGQYTGPALGTRMDNFSGNMTPLTEGHTSLTFDFASGQASGQIGFQEMVLNIDTAGSTWTTGGFRAPFNESSTSELRGSFFGPRAEAVGGSFLADVTGGTYSGVFGGNLGSGTITSPAGP